MEATKSIKERYDNINLDALPEPLQVEFILIKEETKDFTDQDAMDIFQKNFNYLYSAVERKHPTCLKDYVPPPPTPEELKAIADKKLEDEKKQQNVSKASSLADKYNTNGKNKANA